MRHLLLTLLLIPTISSAATTYGNITVTEIRSIYDADTFKVSIPEWPDVIGKSISIRILGIDAPEMRGKCKAEKDAARAAKQFTIKKLRSAEIVELRDMQRDKYFRMLANVFIDCDNLGDMLVKADHAREYNGEWCNSSPTTCRLSQTSIFFKEGQSN